MADNYKILAQTTAASIETQSGVNQTNVVYTVPENAQASISSVSLINSSTTAESYKLGFVKNTDAATSNDPAIAAAFVMQGSKGAYSTNGIDWTFAPAAIGFVVYSLAYGNGKYVFAGFGGNTGGYSYDGLTWTTTVLPYAGIVSDWGNNIEYGNGKFVIISRGGYIGHSSDGINWVEAGNLSEFANTSPVNLFFGNGKFFAQGTGVGDPYLVSEDGISWTQINNPFSISGLVKMMAFGDGKYVSILNTNTAAYSYDGITWQTTSIPNAANQSSRSWLAVVYGGDKFVATGGSYPYLPNQLPFSAYSYDGITWYESQMPSYGEWSRTAYGGGKFVSIGNWGSAAYSYDGITWTATSYPQEVFVNGIVYGTGIPERPALLSAQTAIPTRSIEANTVDEIVGGITLSAGDQIRVYSESSDLIVQVYGVEIA